MHRARLLCVASLFAIALDGSAAAQQVADYGDAPDGGPTGYPAGFAQTGNFPTTEVNDGARALSASGARLGASASVEAGAVDPADPDGAPNLVNTDLDDGITSLVVQLVSIPPPAALGLSVSVPTGGTGGTYFVNVLIDLNMDGDWGDIIQPGVTEWPVQNLPVTVAAGGSVAVTTPFFLFGAGNRLPDPAWMRIAVTSTPAPPGWTGTGAFALGEVEDHLVRLPRIAGKRLPAPGISCPPGLFLFPDGVNQIPFSCTLTNPGAAGNVRYSLTREAGSVTVQSVPPPAPPLGPAARIANIVAMGAGGPPIVLNFLANRGDLPSDWTARAKGVDPPSVVDAQGVIIGFGDSVASVSFDAAPPPERQRQQQQRPADDK